MTRVTRSVWFPVVLAVAMFIGGVVLCSPLPRTLLTGVLMNLWLIPAVPYLFSNIHHRRRREENQR